MQIFFVGFHHPRKAWFFLDTVFVSVSTLWECDADGQILGIDRWVMDSGAFTEISRFGAYRHSVADYAAKIRQFSRDAGLMAAVAQDMMCEPFILAKTGLSVADHQRITIERYDGLLRHDVGGVAIIPVLQGFSPEDYAAHLEAYGDRLAEGAWVGVGSVCKRQGDPGAILAVLRTIADRRPDLRLHGFGVKLTALKDARVAALLHSADSMAWSFAARKQGGDPNSVFRAMAFERKVLEACGIEPGWNLAMRIREGMIERSIEIHDARVAARREARRARGTAWRGTA